MRSPRELRGITLRDTGFVFIHVVLLLIWSNVQSMQCVSLNAKHLHMRNTPACFTFYVLQQFNLLSVHSSTLTSDVSIVLLRAALTNERLCNRHAVLCMNELLTVCLLSPMIDFSNSNLVINLPAFFNFHPVIILPSCFTGEGGRAPFRGHAHWPVLERYFKVCCYQ